MDEGLESGHPADLAVTIWLRVDAALSSVFGQHGVSTLFRRSLYLAQAKYPWLEEVKPTATAVSDFDALRVVLAQHDPSVARAAHTWLLKTFCDLLIKLIGGLLSQSLLQPVWCPLTIGPATPQETRQ